MNTENINALDAFNIKNRPQRDTHWLIKGAVESGRYHVIYGDKGAGKSTFVCGYLIPELMKKGIERVVFLSPGEETTAVDLQVYAAAHAYDPDAISHFADGIFVSLDDPSIDDVTIRDGQVYVIPCEDDDPEVARMNRELRVMTWGASDHSNTSMTGQGMYVPVNLFSVMKYLGEHDPRPTLYVCEGLDEVIPADVAKNYGGTDTIQNRAWKTIIRMIERSLGDQDVFIDVTHTKKGDGSQIKGSTGRYDRARHAIRINKHVDGNSRYTTLVGTGNAATGEWEQERTMLVDDVPPSAIEKAFGTPVVKHRVPHKVFAGFASRQDDSAGLLERLQTLDWSGPVRTADIVVALGLREPTGDSSNDNRTWLHAKNKLPPHVNIVPRKRGYWEWKTAAPASLVYDDADPEDAGTWGATA